MDPEHSNDLFSLDGLIEKLPEDKRDEFVRLRDDFSSKKITKADFMIKVKILYKSVYPGPEDLFRNIRLHLDTYKVKSVKPFKYGSRRLMLDDRYPADEQQLVEIRSTCICEFCAVLIPIQVGVKNGASTSMVTIFANRRRHDVCNACLPKLFEHFVCGFGDLGKGEIESFESPSPSPFSPNSPFPQTPKSPKNPQNGTSKENNKRKRI